MTDYTDLIARLRIVPLHSGFGSTCHAAADALESQARRIAEFKFRIDRLKRCLSIYVMPAHADEINKEW